MNQPTQVSYGIARNALGSRAFVDLAPDEYNAILAARRLILEVLALEEKFDLLVSNYVELEKTLNDLATDHMIRSDYSFQSLHDCRVLINLRVQNLLSACRLYIDHGTHHAGNLNSAAPGLSLDFKALSSQQYDSNASYRIAEALRNHSQHRGFVIGSFSTGGSWVDRKEGRVSLHRIEIRIDYGGLREGGRTKKKILDDIEAFGIKTDARPVFREYVECLGRVHEASRQTVSDSVGSAERLVADSLDRYSTAAGEASKVGISVVARDSTGKWIERFPLLLEMSERRRHFLSRNSSLANLPLRHVSSEPPPPE